ncbi:pectin lyase fold/virulence factor [Earliella scabrosa]|nr:pectin lyase fold/virulence factor [Earliella scabrosa]
MTYSTSFYTIALVLALSGESLGRHITFLAHRKHVLDEAHHNLFTRSELHVRDDCEPADPLNTLTDRLNTLLNSSGPGYTLPLCPGVQYFIQAPILFAAPDQEISTVGYPIGDDRATLVVAGPVADGQGHTTAIDGTCLNCNGVKLRHVQINGTRGGASPTMGGANIEMGGSNADQLVEFVRSYDPRSWSCLHIAEGALACNNVTVQNNDIGPCGSDIFQEWADGISMSCQNSVVRNNMINNPTDGGIVLFGAPGTVVEGNTIWVEKMTLLGGINMVDYEPWNGNYTGTVVRNNVIYGGFATDPAGAGETHGENDEDVIIKIGIAIGPRTWFGDRYLGNVSLSGTVMDNQLSGAFGYGIAISSAQNFVVQGNRLLGNTSFIGSRGPNCSTADTTPTPAAFVQDQNTVQSSSIQDGFQTIPDGDSLTCIVPPDGGDFWPFGGNPSSQPGPSSPTTPGSAQPTGTATPPGASSSHSGLSGGAKAGIAAGVILGVVALAALTYLIRNWAVNRARSTHRY